MRRLLAIILGVALACVGLALVRPDAADSSSVRMAGAGQTAPTNGGYGLNPLLETQLTALRAAWFAEPRIHPLDYFPAGALLAERRQAIALLPRAPRVRLPFERDVPFRGPFTIYRPIDRQTLGRWVPYGPAPLCADYDANSTDCTSIAQPYSGRVTAIAIDPTNPDTIYVGGLDGGVWRTRNGGRAWTPLFDQMPSLTIGALALDPQHPATIFAGTGTAGGFQAYLGVGLFRSGDEGTHWSRVGGFQFDGCAFNALRIDPGDDRFMVAAVSRAPEDTAPTTQCGGVYVSVDGGTTWNRWLDRSQVDDVAFGQPEVLPIDAGPTAGILAVPVYAGVHGEGLYHSTIEIFGSIGYSLGSWVKSDRLNVSPVSAVRIAVAPSDRARLYVLMGEPNDTTLLGAWTSRNGGASWVHFTPPDALWSLMSLAVDPWNPDVLYVGSTWLYRFSHDGRRMTLVSQGDKLHVDVPSLAFDSLDRLYAGTDGGLARTSDGGATFDSLNGNLSISEVYALSGTLHGGSALAPGGRLLAGLQDNGTVQYTGMLAWRQVFGGDDGDSAIDPRHPDTQYATLFELGPVKTTNDWQSLHDAGDRRWRTEARGFIAPFVMDTARPDTLYAGTEFVYRSIDGARSWHRISPDFNSYVLAIAPAASDSHVVYASVGEVGIEVTQNGGTNWTKGQGVPDRLVTGFTVNPTNAAEAWAGLSGFGTGHLFHTTDGGQRWTDVSGDLPDSPVNAVAADYRQSPPLLFVGTDVGVFVSRDGGAHWLVSAGLPNAPIFALLFDASANELVAGTYGRGVWAAPERRYLYFVRPPGRPIRPSVP